MGTGMRDEIKKRPFSLADGKNILKAVVSTKGKEYTDEIEWNYSGEKNREIDSYENKNEHSGF